MKQQIYLDFNASTPICPEAVEAMRPFLTDHYGNPSSLHWAGVPAKDAAEHARGQVAGLLGCDPNEVVFTSGGSESNNHAIKGIFFANRAHGDHIITTAVEHPATINPCRFLEKLGAKITILPVDRFGRVDPDDVRRAITPKTVLITVMHANNEVGTIEPIAGIAGIAKESGIPFHTDAAQSVGKIPADVEELGVDLLSVAGHKVYAPKGIGALYIREGTRIEPFVHGAGHEGGRRAGTESVLLAVALGAACEAAQKWVGMPEVTALRDRFCDGLKAIFGDRVTLNGHPSERLPNTLNVNFVGRVGAEVLAKLPGVAASTGSACHAGSVTLSPVLAAMSVPPDQGMGAVRFSLGRTTRWEDLATVLSMLGQPAAIRGDRRHEHWERVHEERAEHEASWYQARPGMSLDLLSRTGKSSDAGIIDVGGGASRLVDALLDAGFANLTVLDISENALAKAKERLGVGASQVNWVVADITAWIPDRTFDVWHDRALFHFLMDERDRRAYRRAMDAAVPVGGQVIIGTFAEDGPERCTGLPVARYDAKDLAAELGPGYRLIDTMIETHTTPTGKVQRFRFCRFVRI